MVSNNESIQHQLFLKDVDRERKDTMTSTKQRKCYSSPGTISQKFDTILTTLIQRRLTPDRDFIVILEHSVSNSEHVQHVASGKFHLAVIVRCCDIRQDTMNEKLLLKIVWSSSSIFLPLPYFNAELRWKPSKVNCDTVFTLACWLRFHLPLF